MLGRRLRRNPQGLQVGSSVLRPLGRLAGSGSLPEVAALGRSSQKGGSSPKIKGPHLEACGWGQVGHESCSCMLVSTW